MQPPLSGLTDFLTTLDFVGLISCLLVILIMLLRRGYRVRGGGLLLLSFLFLFYPLLIVHLYSTGDIRFYPHLLRTSAPVSMLYLPTVFLYVRTLAIGRPLRRTDALHLLPALVFVIDFLPFYLLPAEAKHDRVLGTNYWNQFLRFDEGWLLPAYWHHPIRSVQLLAYWLLEVRILYGLIRLRETSFLAKNRAWLTWMLTLIGLQALLFIPAAGVTLVGWPSTMVKFWYDLSLTLMALLTCFALMLRPEILYGLQELPEPATPPTEPEPDRESATEKLEHYIPSSLIAVYDRQIREFMQTQEAFRTPGYTLREMADHTGIPLHHLSAVINRHYGYHFNEYINHWRIRYLKQKLDQREWQHKTLEALAQESGFTNRTSFITAFKKHCGTTPSGYVRALKEAD
jgi:AraC-like DNA-binding protein